VRALPGLALVVRLATLATLATLAAGCRRDRCVSVCEQRVRELGCHPTDPCKTTCEKLHTAPTCRPELQVFERCFIVRPTKDWECDLGDGTPVVHADLCLPERQAVMACLTSHPLPPPH
jgi:hypothetical protein